MAKRKQHLWSISNLLTLGALAAPAIQSLTAQIPNEQKLDEISQKYLATGLEGGVRKQTMYFATQTAGTYVAAIIPKLAKKLLAEAGVRSKWI